MPKLRKIRKVKKPRPCPAERHHLVLDNMAWIVELVNRAERHNPSLARVPYEDRLQEAVAHCLPRARDHDPAKGAAPTTWLTYGVRASTSRLTYDSVASGGRLRQQTTEFTSLDEIMDSPRRGFTNVIRELAAPALPCPLEAEDNATYARRVCEAAFRCIPWRQAWAVRLVWLHGLACTQAGLMMGTRWYDVRNLVREGLEGMRGVIRAREGAA